MCGSDVRISGPYFCHVIRPKAVEIGRVVCVGTISCVSVIRYVTRCIMGNGTDTASADRTDVHCVWATVDRV